MFCTDTFLGIFLQFFTNIHNMVVVENIYKNRVKFFFFSESLTILQVETVRWRLFCSY